MDRQPRITDLVPQRYGIILLLFFGGLAVVAGLEALYAWMPELAGMTTDGRVAAFDLDGEGGLAVWFSSMTLFLASVVALLVYTIRRHKTDDYHGRYRIWLYAAACWLLMSIDDGGSLHEGFKEMMTWLTGRRLFGDGSIWWVGAYLGLLGVVGTRLLLDMRSCLASTAALGATAVCYSLAVITQLGWLLPGSGARGVMLEEGAEMVGNLFLLLAMTLHARHVILDAQGLIADKPRRQKKPAAQPAPAAAASSAPASAHRWSWFRKAVHTPHSAPPKPSRRGDLEPATRTAPAKETRRTAEADDYDFQVQEAANRPRKQKPPFDSEEFEPTDDNRKLSKAERKALRRHKQRERRGLD